MEPIPAIIGREAGEPPDTSLLQLVLPIYTQCLLFALIIVCSSRIVTLL